MKATKRTVRQCALALTLVGMAGGQCFAQFPGLGDDSTTSLGQFRLVINPTFQPLMAGYPGYDGAGRFTSPPLYDSATVIGRSTTHLHGGSPDSSGVAVGTAGTVVSDALLVSQPPDFQGPVGTREVHTEVRSLNMTLGSMAVRAGTAAPSVPISPGEVESLSGASSDPVQDFPAESFFDIFVEVDLPAGGSFPGATLSNDIPLRIENTNLTSFPPKVVYIHGNSTAVPIKFTTTTGSWTAGDTFGVLVLAGHGLDYNTNIVDQNDFQAIMASVPEAPVDPQYSTWAPGLTVSSGNDFPALGDDVTQSLGVYRVLVNPAYQGLFASASYPGYDSITKRLQSPILYDNATTIGRSSAHEHGSPADASGVTVGTTAPALVSDFSFALPPPVFQGPAGTREVHTKVTSFDMSQGGVGPPRVRAGSAAPGVPLSPGEVESLAGNSGNTNWDFPAQSFFDIFVEVDLVGAGPIPPFTVTNAEPLIVEDNNLLAFPPRVIYTHGGSSAVPMLFTTANPPDWAAGDVFGILMLAGHGLDYSIDRTNDVSEFQDTMELMPELQVDPIYATWGPGLIVKPTRPTLRIIVDGPQVIVEGNGMPNTQYNLLHTPQLLPPIPWNPIGNTISDPSGNFQFVLPPATSLPEESYFQAVGPPMTL